MPIDCYNNGVEYPYPFPRLDLYYTATARLAGFCFFLRRCLLGHYRKGTEVSGISVVRSGKDQYRSFQEQRRSEVRLQGIFGRMVGNRFSQTGGFEGVCSRGVSVELWKEIWRILSDGALCYRFIGLSVCFFWFGLVWFGLVWFGDSIRWVLCLCLCCGEFIVANLGTICLFVCLFRSSSTIFCIPCTPLTLSTPHAHTKLTRRVGWVPTIMYPRMQHFCGVWRETTTMPSNAPCYRVEMQLSSIMRALGQSLERYVTWTSTQSLIFIHSFVRSFCVYFLLFHSDENERFPLEFGFEWHCAFVLGFRNSNCASMKNETD